MPTFIQGDGAPRVIRAGNVTVDKYGLATGQVTWWAFSYDVMLGSRIIRIGSPHPKAPSLGCEKIEYVDTEGGATAVASYAGLLGGATPIYEIDSGSSCEPIETHPDFASFAGSLGAEVNGAIFDPDNGSFLKFGNDAPNEFRGVTSYLVPTPIVRRTTISLSAPSTSTVGRRESPPATFGAVGTWLKVSVNSERRGNVYVSREEWKASGPRGWSTTIYS